MSEDASLPENELPQGSSVRIRRLRHPVRVVTFAAVVILCLVAAFWGGSAINTREEDAIQIAQHNIPVFAEVETRVVSTEIREPLSLVAGKIEKVFVDGAPKQASATKPAPEATPPPAGAPAAGDAKPAERPAYAPEVEAAVVSGVTTSPGSRLNVGDVIGEVSGRPIIAVPADTPLFRNMIGESQGEDVAAIQRMLIGLGYLEGEADGFMNWASLNAMSRLYEAHGYKLPFVGPGVTGISWLELAPIPQSSVVVVEVAPLGQVLSSDNALIAIEASPPVLKAAVTADVGAKLPPGTQVGLQIGVEAPVPVTIQHRGEIVADEATKRISQDLILPIPEGISVEAIKAQLATLTSTEPTPESLAVPLLAVHQDHGVSYVLVPLKDGEKPPAADPAVDAEDAADEARRGLVRVVVQPTQQAEGWVGISDTEALPPGTAVLVSK